ncbi:MFS transporter [Pseudarthrobacter sp. NPDC058119]|uniref:MFS transporter n=1 Tax=Pseudarthrobacter sp. NPDC058119 TaxID=3346348 RepID=UPI0036D9D10B
MTVSLDNHNLLENRSLTKREKLNPMARRALAAGTVGTLIEWYDYGLYGAASALIIGPLFFSELSGSAGVLAAFATFAVGFFIRPLGGLVMAHFGDRYGRKPVLIATIVLMGAATVLMGLLPTFGQIGIWAPILLVVLRMLQGAGAGAELAGAMTMVAENPPNSRRSYLTSIPNRIPARALFIALLAYLAVSSLPEADMLGWGWRIPFLASGVLFVVALYIRHRLEETPEFVQAKEKSLEEASKHKVPLVQLLRTHPREVIFGALSGSTHNGNFYVLTAFSVTYLTTQVGMTKTESLAAMATASLCACLSAPIMGNIADRIGARKMYAFSGAALAVLAFPLFAALNTGNMLVICAAMGACSIIVFGCGAGGQGAFLANLFPTEYRFSGIAITRELNAMAVAGPTPFIATALVAALHGAPWLVAGYLVLCGVVTLVSVLAVKDRYGKAGKD